MSDLGDQFVRDYPAAGSRQVALWIAEAASAILRQAPAVGSNAFRPGQFHPDRATLVAPTDEGTKVGQAIRASRDAEAEAYFSVLSDDERADLAGILRKLRR